MDPSAVANDPFRHDIRTPLPPLHMTQAQERDAKLADQVDRLRRSFPSRAVQLCSLVEPKLSTYVESAVTSLVVLAAFEAPVLAVALGVGLYQQEVLPMALAAAAMQCLICGSYAVLIARSTRAAHGARALFGPLTVHIKCDADGLCLRPEAALAEP